MYAGRRRKQRPRPRSENLRRVAAFFVAHLGLIWTTEKQDSAELGACLSVRDMAREIGLDPEERLPSGYYRHSPAQLRYVRDLLEDLPAAVARQLALGDETV